MGCSPHHPAAGQVARGRAGPWRTAVPVLVGCDAPDEFPAGRQNPWGLRPCGVSMLLVSNSQRLAKYSSLCAMA
jgi:hypothetical protein